MTTGRGKTVSPAHFELSTIHYVRKALAWATALFHEKGISSSRLDAELLLANALGIERVELYKDPSRFLTFAQRCLFRRLIRRRVQGDPLAYILGRKEFWSLELRVSSSVLIPRPETELLVETALRLADGFQGVNSAIEATADPDLISEETLSILDLGTGSGNIAIALARELPAGRIVALDLSLKALRLAQTNARIHGVLSQIGFLCGDLYAPLKDFAHSFHLIVSNPPYISQEGLGHLPPEAREHEPRLALDGGVGGLAYYRRIIAGAAPYLAKGGRLLLELGYGQFQMVSHLLEGHPFLAFQEVLEDHAGIPRVLVAKGRS